MLSYRAIEIFTSEEARYRSRPLADAVIQFVRDLKTAARCIVTRGTSGCYESGEMASDRLEIVSYNLPVRIYIVFPAMETERVLDGLSGMVGDGMVVLHDLNVQIHRTRKTLFPGQLTVRDVMTSNPESVNASTPLNEVARLLLSSVFTGLPVLDEGRRPVGVITQGDLVRKAGLPLRLGLLAESDRNDIETVLSQLASKTASEVMTGPAIHIEENRPLSEAVDMMLKNGVKRLPVVDSAGCLAGVLSRLDIFRTIMRESPDWNAFKAQKIEVGHLKRVGDITRRDMHSVLPDTTLNRVIQMIGKNDIQRVAVVGEGGRLLGIIADKDLLRFFRQDKEGMPGLLARIRQAFQKDACAKDFHQCLAGTSAGSAMTTELVTVREGALIEDAIKLMVEKGLKRLPVVDEEGVFKGMISRDSLLRTGFGHAEKG